MNGRGKNRRSASIRFDDLFASRFELTHGKKQIRVDESPDGSDESVEPLYTLRHGRTELLSSLLVHLKPDSLDLLLELPRGSPSQSRSSKPNSSKDRGEEEESKPSASEGDEDPDDEGGGDGEESETVETEEDGGEGGRSRWREGLKGDVGRMCRGRTDSGVMDC